MTQQQDAEAAFDELCGYIQLEMGIIDVTLGGVASDSRHARHDAMLLVRGLIAHYALTAEELQAP